jgi:tetratricopeptide (TPR) repeat protein
MEARIYQPYMAVPSEENLLKLIEISRNDPYRGPAKYTNIFEARALRLLGREKQAQALFREQMQAMLGKNAPVFGSGRTPVQAAYRVAYFARFAGEKRTELRWLRRTLTIADRRPMFEEGYAFIAQQAAYYLWKRRPWSSSAHTWLRVEPGSPPLDDDVQAVLTAATTKNVEFIDEWLRRKEFTLATDSQGPQEDQFARFRHPYGWDFWEEMQMWRAKALGQPKPTMPQLRELAVDVIERHKPDLERIRQDNIEFWQRAEKRHGSPTDDVLQNAFDHANRALERDNPKHAVSNLHPIARIHWLLGRNDEAADAYRELQAWRESQIMRAASFDANSIHTNSYLGAANMARLAGDVESAVKWYETALDVASQRRQGDTYADWYGADAAYWLHRIDPTHALANEWLQRPDILRKNEDVAAALAAANGDFAVARTWLAATERVFAADKEGPHEVSGGGVPDRKWDFWVEIQNRMAEHDGRPALSGPDVRALALQMFEREAQARKARRKKRKAWTVDATSARTETFPYPADPPFDVAFRIYPGADGASVEMYLNTAFEEAGIVRFDETAHDGMWQIAFVDAVDSDDPDYPEPVGQDREVVGEWESFDAAVEYLVEELEHGDDHDKYNAAVIRFIADRMG